ncbi:UPF0695 membrane protein [Spathaspora sp. JA1]|nr:UPF0695 membrane protein [Spathaspora sp. JA1]
MSNSSLNESVSSDIQRRVSLTGGSMLRRRSSIESTRLERRRTIEEEFSEVAAENVGRALPEGFNAKFSDFRETTFLIKTKKYHSIILNIIHGAIWGVLVRKGLTVLTTYNGSYLSGVVWANFTACIVMGLFVDGEEVWSILVDEHADKYPHKGAIPLYTGVTTGFCGTVSSFSSVILEAFNKAADTEIGISYNYPNGAYGIMQFLGVILAQFGLSIMGFHIGKQTSAVVDNYIRPLKKHQYQTLESISIGMAIILTIITCVLIGVEDDGAWRSWTFSMFFAPFGAVLRFYLSKYLNSKIENFPLGTFTANVGGSLLLGIFTLIGRGRLGAKGRINTSIIGCHVLNGLDDGFCGGLTTVSTFVVELFGLKTVYGYQYGVSSIMVSFAMIILVLGTYNWTVGLTDPYCS